MWLRGRVVRSGWACGREGEQAATRNWVGSAVCLPSGGGAAPVTPRRTQVKEKMETKDKQKRARARLNLRFTRGRGGRISSSRSLFFWLDFSFDFQLRNGSLMSCMADERALTPGCVCHTRQAPTRGGNFSNMIYALWNVSGVVRELRLLKARGKGTTNNTSNSFPG